MPYDDLGKEPMIVYAITCEAVQAYDILTSGLPGSNVQVPPVDE